MPHTPSPRRSRISCQVNGSGWASEPLRDFVAIHQKLSRAASRSVRMAAIPRISPQTRIGIARSPGSIDDPDPLASRLDKTAITALTAAIFLFLDLGPAPGGVQSLE